MTTTTNKSSSHYYYLLHFNNQIIIMTRTKKWKKTGSLTFLPEVLYFFLAQVIFRFTTFFQSRLDSLIFPSSSSSKDLIEKIFFNVLSKIEKQISKQTRKIYHKSPWSNSNLVPYRWFVHTLHFLNSCRNLICGRRLTYYACCCCHSKKAHNLFQSVICVVAYNRKIAIKLEVL